MSTTPSKPTRPIPHSLGNIQLFAVNHTFTNLFMYAFVNVTTWRLVGDVINRFRRTDLGLETLNAASASNLVNRLKVPHPYFW